MKQLLKAFSRKSCNEFETDLVLYAYGKVTSDEVPGVEAHLDACASCRSRQDQLLKELATAPIDFPPTQFWHDYTREMQGKLASIEERPNKMITWMTPLRVGGIAATAVALVLVLTLGIALKDSILSSGNEPQGDTMMEVLPIVQNLEFFESMHYLEMLGNESDAKIKSSDTRQLHRIMITRTRERFEKDSQWIHKDTLFPSDPELLWIL